MISLEQNFSSSHIPDLCEDIFCQDGLLQKFLNFEYRNAQKQMAYFCAQAFEADDSLLFEAGTGVGKSLAYLIPAIISAVESKRQVFISTHTISLQEQIIKKDLPLIRKFFENCDELKKYTSFTEAILIGKSNYLCTKRLFKAIAEKSDIFNSAETQELERIVEWSTITKTGLVDELNPPPNPQVWDWVNAQSSLCTSKKCADSDCFYQAAKRAVSRADIVILNHSLVFSLMASAQSVNSETRGILFQDDLFVFDEAHLLPDIASEHFGISVSDYSIIRELHKIYNPKFKKGLLCKVKSATVYDKDSVLTAIAACEEFFNSLRKKYLLNRQTVALSAPEWADTVLCNALNNLKQILESLAMRSNDESLTAELKDVARTVVSISLSLEDAIFLSTNNFVYWLEKSGKDGNITTISSAPINVASILREKIFSKGVGVIMTSATLSLDGKSMDNFVSQVGGEIAQVQICQSPFDYAKNARMLLCSDSPDLDNNKRMSVNFLAESIFNMSSLVDGGTLVLFTNYSELKSTAEILRELLPNKKILVQGEKSRTQLMEEFKASENSLLLGTDSFWTGIDIKGKTLSLVIITRLPFSNPDHPLLAAKIDAILQANGNPFAEISLPQAIIKMRQGAGRLIRSHADKGIVAILDKRILTKAYGKDFISSLPFTKFERFCKNDIKEKLLSALNEIGFDSQI